MHHHHLSSGAGTTGQLVADIPSGLGVYAHHRIKKNVPLRMYLTTFHQMRIKTQMGSKDLKK
jgi:hypothetical protein